jgi:hypothetical protein
MVQPAQGRGLGENPTLLFGKAGLRGDDTIECAVRYS